MTPEHEKELLAAIKRDGTALAGSVDAALSAGVSEALVLPAVFEVFAEAGMMPAGLDMKMLLGMLPGLGR